MLVRHVAPLTQSSSSTASSSTNNSSTKTTKLIRDAPRLRYSKAAIYNIRSRNWRTDLCKNFN